MSPPKLAAVLKFHPTVAFQASTLIAKFRLKLKKVGKTNRLFKESKSEVLSHVRLFVTSWTVTYQAPPTMGFSKQEYWSGVPLPSPFQSLVTVNGENSHIFINEHFVLLLL